MLLTDDWFPIIFNLPESSPFTERFEILDFGTTHFIMNLGTLFVVAVF